MTYEGINYTQSIFCNSDQILLNSCHCYILRTIYTFCLYSKVKIEKFFSSISAKLAAYVYQ